MSEQLNFYVDADGSYLGAMGGELLEDSPHPYPDGKQVDTFPDSLEQRWDFKTKAWADPVSGNE